MNKLKVLKRKEDTFVQRQISYGQEAIILSCAHRLGYKKKKKKDWGCSRVEPKLVQDRFILL